MSSRPRKWTTYQYPFAFRQVVVCELKNILKAEDRMPEHYRIVRAPSFHEQMHDLSVEEIIKQRKVRRRKITFLTLMLFTGIILIAASLFLPTDLEDDLTNQAITLKYQFMGRLEYFLNGVNDIWQKWVVPR